MAAASVLWLGVDGLDDVVEAQASARSDESEFS